MKKINEINELVSELNEYDGELTVYVYSQGANKAYPISHVGQGHTDGVLDTYVSIVVDDDRNLVDLSKIWHDASEEPNYNELMLGIDSDGVSLYKWCGQEDSWKTFVDITELIHWAYISDLLPKGGEK